MAAAAAGRGGMAKSANEGFTGEAWSEMADTQQKGCMKKRKNIFISLRRKRSCDVAVSAEVDGGGADQVKRHAKHGVAITTGTGAWREIKTVMFVSGLEVKKKKRVK